MKIEKNLLITSCILAFLISCGETNDDNLESDKPEDSIEEISTENEDEIIETLAIAEDVESEIFKQYIDEGKGLLLDVRTAEEYNEGHIEGALNIDFYDDSFEISMDSLDASIPILVYCQGGGRSGKTMSILAEKGFVEVYNLLGGYGNWPFK